LNNYFVNLIPLTGYLGLILLLILYFRLYFIYNALLLWK